MKQQYGNQHKLINQPPPLEFWLTNGIRTLGYSIIITVKQSFIPLLFTPIMDMSFNLGKFALFNNLIQF